MAGRNPKPGLDYSGWDVDIFDNDTKMDELIDGQGWIGFSIYFYLCQKAYGSDGYFYRWSYANAATTARKMGGGVGSETVRQTVALCLRIGLFDNRLFEGEGVLTSRGIQKRYCEAIQKRSYKVVIREYWLLNSGESKGLLIVPLNRDEPNDEPHSLPDNANFLPENDHSLPENSDISKVKYSKVKYKEDNTSCGKPQSVSPQQPIIPPVIELLLNDKTEYGVSESDIATYAELFPAVNIIQELRKMKGWLISNPSKRKTRRGIKRFINFWLSNEQDRGGGRGRAEMIPAKYTRTDNVPLRDPSLNPFDNTER